MNYLENYRKCLIIGTHVRVINCMNMFIIITIIMLNMVLHCICKSLVCYGTLRIWPHYKARQTLSMWMSLKVQATRFPIYHAQYVCTWYDSSFLFNASKRVTWYFIGLLFNKLASNFFYKELWPSIVDILNTNIYGQNMYLMDHAVCILHMLPFFLDTTFGNFSQPKEKMYEPRFHCICSNGINKSWWSCPRGPDFLLFFCGVYNRDWLNYFQESTYPMHC